MWLESVCLRGTASGVLSYLKNTDKGIQKYRITKGYLHRIHSRLTCFILFNFYLNIVLEFYAGQFPGFTRQADPVVRVIVLVAISIS